MLDADTLKKLEQRQTELADIFIDETDSRSGPTPRRVTRAATATGRRRTPAPRRRSS
jgi:hypothetical protein